MAGAVGQDVRSLRCVLRDGEALTRADELSAKAAAGYEWIALGIERSRVVTESRAALSELRALVSAAELERDENYRDWQIELAKALAAEARVAEAEKEREQYPEHRLAAYRKEVAELEARIAEVEKERDEWKRRSTRWGESGLVRAAVRRAEAAERELRLWLAWSNDQRPDHSPGDVIAAELDGTIILDDGITTWNPLRSGEFFNARAVAAEARVAELETALSHVGASSLLKIRAAAFTPEIGVRYTEDIRLSIADECQRLEEYVRAALAPDTGEAE